MQPKGGVFVCTGCGAEAQVRNEDGSPAVFGPAPGPASASWPLMAALLILLAGLAAAGWCWRGELLERLPGARAGAASAPPETPGRRLARRGDFAQPLQAGLMGVFAASGEGRTQAFAVLVSGELVTVPGPPPGEPGTAAIVRMNGAAEPATILPEAPAGLLGASLSAGRVTGFYVALTQASGVRLLAWEEGASPAWTRETPLRPAPQRKAEVVAGGGQVYLAGPAESPGRLSVAACGEDGAQLWQHSFGAPKEGRAFAAAPEEGGLFLAFGTSASASCAQVLAVWLSEGGETTQALAGIGIGGRLAGARPGAGRALLLVEGPAVSLEAVSAEGDVLWRSPAAQAALHEALSFEMTAPGEAGAVSVQRLSDIRTDLTFSRLPRVGALLGEDR